MNVLPTNPNFNGQPLSLTSREIAELCGKLHKHVLRDIEKMTQDIAEPKFGLSDFLEEYKDATGRALKQYRLPRDLVVTLVTGYRADLRYKVVKRLEELEAQGPAPMTEDQMIAQSMAILTGRVEAQAAKIAEMTEEVEAHKRLVEADGSLNVTEAAKALGVRPKDLFQWLSANKWLYKRNGAGAWLGYAARCNAGDLEHKTTTVLRADGSEKITEQVRITARGLSKLAKLVPYVAREVVA